ncbi:zinc-dependent metalloprotease [Glutamicibacter sp. PS]|uniref:zinc-dependent metalloprotease n=1 Tax=Glutamicibacter sp. PS TaxID=3075634 RepID=UPI00283CACCC|nr:zinc-dependent metalloprotease [Glutamicibacter sp. PS]MDR4534829.1 zinc-dependent metalloprotease [Glutamicibacter sp. PS]
MTQWIDWELALRTAKGLIPAGPMVSATEAAQIVAGLREAAQTGLQHAEEISRLQSTGQAQTLVVDRAGWATAMSQNIQAMLPQLPKVPAALPVIAGAEVGAVISVLSTRVLGQFDPFSGPRLLLNAPTITQIRGELNLNARDFYLWVATHEQTHRLQFEHAPWIPSVFTEALEQVFEGIGSGTHSMAQLAEKAKQISSEVGELTCIMSVLEGHAMVVMNDVTTIGSIKTIRRRFAARGQNRSPLATWIGKLLGLDAKARQYERGAKFVRHAVDAMGYEGFNRIFAARENFPNAAELDDPQRWVERMS